MVDSIMVDSIIMMLLITSLRLEVESRFRVLRFFYTFFQFLMHTSGSHFFIAVTEIIGTCKFQAFYDQHGWSPLGTYGTYGAYVNWL
jgi:hypothetical protein